MTGTSRTAGRLIADALAAAGVRVAYTVPGESFLTLLDGLAGAGIRVVATRHEGAAAYMAAASAALSGRPAVVLGTRAVGAANLAIGLHVAHADSLPVIALVGQVKRSTRGREGFQEADLVATVGGFCRWAREVRDAAALPAAIEEALRRATTGRPGPVLLSLPEDLLDEEVAAAPARTTPGPVPGPARTLPDPVHVRRILHLLLDAERPVIVAGGGVLRSRATADLVRLAELVDVPVIAAWRRPDVFPNDNPRYLGMSGYFAAPTVRSRLEDADAILVIGSRLNEIASYQHAIPAPGTRWAHVDVEPLGTRPGLAGPTLALAADARTFLREARRIVATGVLDFAGLERRRAATARDRAAYEEARRVDLDVWDGEGVHPGRVIATLNRVLSPDTIITTDAGHFGGWAARGLVLRRPGTFLGTTAGAMGFAIPAAVAASLAGPGRPVVALVGDGGAGMSIAELETAVRTGVHPVVLVFDNQRYGTIHDHQVQRGLTPVATDLGPVDWVRVAEGYGAAGARVDRDDAFEPALRAALAASRPTVLHLVVDRRWVSVDRIGEAVVEPDAGPAFEPCPDAEPELDAEPIAEPEPEWAAETEAAPEPEPEPAADPGPAAEAEPAEMAEPEAAMEPEVLPVPEAAPEPEAVTEPEAAPEPEPGIPETP
ncbi:MAG: thiamine pyrophosphate-binding protein [Candidatus Limnocylindrales bacterium]|nr:thiamine pyrophosphate-binding protein [Candidatus Limnocylindrales bacterium]